MPRLSDTMTDGTVATWLKKVGDTVAEGDILAKSKPIKLPWNSNLSMLELYYSSEFNEGESAPVDSVLAIIGPAGTDITGIAENYKKGGAAPPSFYNRNSKSRNYINRKNRRTCSSGF
jgi:pyruvate dehydrogenase E2 component (dihydrolipoamide acetyltransferase)